MRNHLARALQELLDSLEPTRDTAILRREISNALISGDDRSMQQTLRRFDAMDTQHIQRVRREL